LDANPTIREALEFEFVHPTTDLRALLLKFRIDRYPALAVGEDLGIVDQYDDWPESHKEMLAVAFDHYARALATTDAAYSNLTDPFPVEAMPENLMDREIFPLDTHLETIISVDAAWKLYLNQVAMQMALLTTDTLPWTDAVLDHDSISATTLYSSTKMFIYSRYPRNNIERAETDELYGAPGYYVVTQNRRPREGIIPYSPSAILQELAAIGMDFRTNTSQWDQVGQLLEWSTRFRHALLQYSNEGLEAELGLYWGGYNFKTMFIEPTLLASFGGRVVHLTGGCGTTTQFMFLLLKLGSIPVEFVGSPLMHRRPKFILKEAPGLPAEGYLLSHGDSPYNLGSIFNHLGPIDYTNMLLSEEDRERLIQETIDNKKANGEYYQTTHLSEMAFYAREAANLSNIVVSSYCQAVDQTSFEEELAHANGAHNFFSATRMQQYPLTSEVFEEDVLVPYAGTEVPFLEVLTYDHVGELMLDAGLDCATAAAEEATRRAECRADEQDRIAAGLTIVDYCPDPWTWKE
jgi:hypothetical protein